jgi:hypothetical protein
MIDYEFTNSTKFMFNGDIPKEHIAEAIKKARLQNSPNLYFWINGDKKNLVFGIKRTVGYHQLYKVPLEKLGLFNFFEHDPGCISIKKYEDSGSGEIRVGWYISTDNKVPGNKKIECERGV